MKQYLAMVIYRALVEGKPTGSLDVQVRYFLASTEKEVRGLLEREPPSPYPNPDGQEVLWEVRGILAVEELAKMESGDELIGFIMEADELAGLA